MAGSCRARPGKRHSSPDLDDALAFRIHRTNRLLRTHLSRFLDQHEPGLSPEQWFVVARVAHHAPVRQIDLAEPVLGDPPNVSRLVDVLVSRGYLERSPDPADRRSSLLSLTRRGDALSKTLLDHAVTERQLVFEGFDDDELDLLAAALDRIDANVRRLLADRSG
jgi:DNA-binding MarR family transcriptional regulator